MPTRLELPWDLIQAELHSAIRTGFPDKRFIKSDLLAEYIERHFEAYPLCGNDKRTIKTRISLAFRKDVMKAGWKRWNGNPERRVPGTSIWLVPWVSE